MKLTQSVGIIFECGCEPPVNDIVEELNESSGVVSFV